MPTALPEVLPARTPRLRSGTAARLAGLPVTTLRVWERRYGVVAASKTERGQRMYSGHDVSRLRLLRQLTLAGHAIGTIATLELAPLQALLAGEAARKAGAAAGVRRAVVVVGRGAAHALEAAPGCALVAVYDDLDQAEAGAAPPGGVGLLVVRLASLQPLMVERLLALAQALRAGASIVVYAFGTEAAASALRAAGVTVRREPLSSQALTQLVSGAREPTSPAEPVWPVAPRRFDDQALAELAELPPQVACECVRHMSEIVAQLAGFERYSRDCVAGGLVDAALHRQLNHTAGVARTLFETALQQLINHEGLTVTHAQSQ